MAKNNTAVGCGTLLVLAVVLGGCMKLVSAVFGTDDEPSAAVAVAKPIPDLMKKSLVQAENEVAAIGVELSPADIGGDSYCDVKSKCIVYRMEPKAGTVVQPGGKVEVRFVTTEEWAWYRKHRKMPNVVGWSEDKAEKLFDQVRETLDSELKESSRVPESVNQVIRQSPKAGAPLRIGQKIKLVVGFNLGSTYTNNGDTNVDVDVNRNSGESRFCSSRWWC